MSANRVTLNAEDPRIDVSNALYARARFAVDFRCGAVRLMEPGAGFRLLAARHPLLIDQGIDVVPFDLEMAPDELPPGHGLLALGCRREAMAFEDVADRLITDRIAQVGQGTHDAVIAPRAVLAGHPDHQVLDLCVNAGTTNRFPWGRGIHFGAGELTVPGEDRGRLGNGGDCFQGLLTQLLANFGKCFAIAVRQVHATAHLLAEDTVLRCKVGIAQPELFVNRLCDRPQQFLPVHASCIPTKTPSMENQYGRKRSEIQAEACLMGEA